MAPEIVVVDLDLDVDGDYETFISALREKLAHHHPLRDHYIATYGAWLQDHPLLPEQRTPRQPARWMHINLKFQDLNTDETIGTTIAVRDDNVYLIGFRNGNGQWYEFGFEGRSTRFIEGSTFLGCDLTYSELVGGSANLVDLNLGKHAAMLAVRRLWAYQQVVPADPATRKDLARMCVMICESARMMPHYDTVNGGWNTGIRISGQHAGYITNWKSMSRKLMSIQGPNPERDSLLAVVHLLLNSPPYGNRAQQHQQQQEQSPTPGAGGSSKRRRGKHAQALLTPSSPPAAGGSSKRRRGKYAQALLTPSSPPAAGGGTQRQGRMAGKSVSGRPLVEVYSVEAKRGVGIDTIVVFDGKRGQIINKHDDHDESRSRRTSTSPYLDDRLVLTGPYRAISSEGSFVIQVDGIPGTDSSDNSSKVSGDLFWDCYAEEVVYDKVLKTDVLSRDTGSRLVEVTYEVLSDAVEATVEVNLLVPGITHVYGKISLSVGIMDEERDIQLFEREQGQKVELVPSSDDLMVPLELLRSVIAVPVHTSNEVRDTCLCIRVGLHAVTPNNEDDVLLDGLIFCSFDKHTGEIRVQDISPLGYVVPVGWTGGSDPTGGSGASHGIRGATTSVGHGGTEQTSMQQCKVQVNVTSPGFHISSDE